MVYSMKKSFEVNPSTRSRNFTAVTMLSCRCQDPVKMFRLCHWVKPLRRATNRSEQRIRIGFHNRVTRSKHADTASQQHKVLHRLKLQPGSQGELASSITSFKTEIVRVSTSSLGLSVWFEDLRSCRYPSQVHHDILLLCRMCPVRLRAPIPWGADASLHF